jgi:NADH-quinone oxidoreductase subunit A
MSHPTPPAYLWPYLPIPIILAVAVLFGLITLTLSRLIGPRRPNPAKALAYECGNIPLGQAFVRLPIKFYLVALLFLLFDVETVMILAWAVAFRDPSIPHFQPYALAVMLFFMVFLAVGFVYEWRKGALQWN